MLSGLFFLNQKGDIIMNRLYRDNISRRSIENFRIQVIAAKETGSQPPIKYYENSTFIYRRHDNIYLVAVTKMNMNAALTLQFLLQLDKILQVYCGENYTEDSIKDNFTLIYELLDETMDYGYPQTCSVDVLKLYLHLGKNLDENIPTTTRNLALTSQITGAIDWRREGIRYKKNELFLDVYESVNVLISTSGVPLRKDVSGQVIMKAFLSGMPECKLGINDKLVMEKENETKKRSTPSTKKNISSVEIDDCTFHRCVRLGKFDTDRTIAFIPPDGEFELMRYRITDNVNLPFKIIPIIQEEGKTRLTINLKVTSMISSRLTANNVIIKIPVPPNTARSRITPRTGTVKFEPEQKCLIWRIRRFPGKTECALQGEVDLAQGLKEKQWIRPPLSMEFQVPMFTASGLHIRFLKVLEKSSYETVKWVRYVTRGGQYQLRI